MVAWTVILFLLNVYIIYNILIILFFLFRPQNWSDSWAVITELRQKSEIFHYRLAVRFHLLLALGFITMCALKKNWFCMYIETIRYISTALNMYWQLT